VPDQPSATAFEALSWHDPVWERLVAWRKNGRLPHALRISGPRGTGKRILAERLAGWLLCESSGSEAAACGQCKQCRLREGGSHPDLQVSSPESSRYIRIDQIRRLAEFLSQSPQVASGKVVIIDRADQLNINAANALLKTLEEPVDDATLLLLHDEGKPLLPTIRSRCQVLALKNPERKPARDWLSVQMTGREEITEQTLEAALDLAGGAPLLARDYLVDGLLSERERCLDALRGFLKREIPLMDAARPFVDAGLEKTLDFMAHWIHDMARLTENIDGDDAAARDMLLFLVRHNDPARIQALFASVREARAGLDYNLNPTLEVERLLMGWQGMMPGKRRAS